MRHRSPSTDLSEALITHNFPEPEERTLSYKVKVITPIYGGGVEAGVADEAMPIRATSIRGQLRYWWRLLQSNKPDSPIKGTALFDAEREIWGGMAEEGKDHSSKIFLRVNSSELKTSTIDVKTYLSTNRNQKAALGYALFSAVQNDARLLECTGHLTLDIRAPKSLSDENWDTVKQAIRWWASFGGIGARTRRGLGSVEVTGLGPVTKEEAEQFKCQLKQIKATQTDKQTAWAEAVKKLQQFRQGEGVGRNPGKSNRPGRSRWPEPDSIREITNKADHPIEHPARQSFPRAAFGLPIIYEIKASGAPGKTELVPSFSEKGETTVGTRMSSPLTLKAMYMGGNKYSAIALCLPTDHIKGLSLSLKSIAMQQHGLPKDFAANEWWDASKADKVEPIYTNSSEDKPATDALSAFLNYFEGN